MYITRFRRKLNAIKTDKNDMLNFILSNIDGNYYGLRLSDIEQKFLDNLYNAINIKIFNDTETLKNLSAYKVSNSDISDVLLYILGGGEKYRYNKKSTWLERTKTSLMIYINKLYSRFCMLPSYRKSIFNIYYDYIPNKNIDFFIDYINSKGYK